MNHYFVSFEHWFEGVYCVSPHTWADAETPEQAELVARKRLGSRVKPELAMTTCVRFSEEDYAREMARLGAYYKARGCDDTGRNPNLN